MRSLRSIFGQPRRTESMTCQDVIALLSRYLDGALSPGQWTQLETHLAACGNCSEHLAQIRASIRLAGQTEPDELDPATRNALSDLYRSWQQPT